VTTGINLLDIAIPIILLLYFLAGVRSGFFTTLGTFLGLGLGVCAAAWLVPLAVASVGSQWSLITAVGVLIICLTIGQWLGLVAGRTIRRVTDITPLKGIERFFGGVLNLAACALVMVVLTISMRTVPIPQLNTVLSESKTLSWMVASTPEVVKDRINTVRNDVLAFGTIPEVSQLIAPETSAPTQTVESAALDQAAASVVEILGAAEQCGYTSTGSGFVADNGLVVTNAHVVAGVTPPLVADATAAPSGSRVGGGLGSARYCRGLAGADRVHGCHVCDDAAVAFFDLARPVAGGGAGVLPGDVLAGQRVR